MFGIIKIFKKKNMISKPKFDCDICVCSFEKQKYLSAHFNTLKHKNNLGIYENKECIICDIQFKSITLYDRHIDTAQHQNKTRIYEEKMLKIKQKEELYESIYPIFYIDNTQILIDQEVYTFMITNDIKVYYNNKYDKYIKISYSKLNPNLTNLTYSSLHLFIYYFYYKNIKDENKPNIDHRNRNVFDNRLINLIPSTNTENAANRSKAKNKTSEYYGVSLCKNAWICSVKINKIKHKYSYKLEIHAAYHHDLIIKEEGMAHIYPLNDIEEPINFIRRTHHVKNDELPPGIVKKNKCYQFSTCINNNIKYHSYYTLEEAIHAKHEFEEKKKADKIEHILSQPIQRDIYGVAVLELHNKKKEIVAYAQVDDDKYYDVVLFDWYLMDNKYAKNSKMGLLSRYIMNYDGPLKVDHRDHNTLNDRTSNLRICTQTQNSQNKSSKEGSSSIYVGVYKTKYNTWKANATVNKKNIIKKTFKTELEAVKARDKAVYEYNQKHNTMFHINLPEKLIE